MQTNFRRFDDKPRNSQKSIDTKIDLAKTNLWVNNFLSKTPYKRNTDNWYSLHVHWDMSESFRARPF